MQDFPPFRLDTVNQCLWRRQETAQDERLLLTPKAFAVLRYLVEHAGQLVTQEELLAAVWPETYIKPEVLKSRIFEIRGVLGDRPKTPRFIETLPRRGYRFIAAVCDTPPAPPAEPVQPDDGRLVGRARALGALRECLHRSLRRQRQMVFLTGEPGIGKTALVDAFQQQALAAVPELRLAHGQCLEGYGGKEAYYPMLEALAELCRGAGGDAVVHAMVVHAPTWLVQFPALVTREHRDTLHRELLGATRERMLREIAALLETITAEQPLLLVFEDLQWVDHATVDLLAALARRRMPAQLLLVATYRPLDLAFWDHPLKTLTQELLVHQLCHEMALEPLSEAEVAAYLAQVASGARLPEGLAGLLYRHSEGNPLFMRVVLDHLTQQGILVRAPDRWQLQVPLTGLVLEVPESVRQVIEAQIARLHPEEQRVLEAASVHGAVFTAGVSAAAADLEADAFEDVCDTLARRQYLVRAVDVQPGPDGSVSQRYAFVHALYRDVCYWRQVPGRRARLHRRIGEWLEAAYAARRSEVAAELAHHFEAGADGARAITYLQMVADTAVRRYAYREAATTLQRALTLAHHLPEATERTQREQAVDLRLALRSALYPSGDFARILAYLHEAEALAVALDDPGRLAQVLLFLSDHFRFMSAYDQTLAAAQRAVTLATASGDVVLHALANQHLGQAYQGQGDYRQAIDCLRQTAACFDGERRHERVGRVILPAVTSRADLAWCHAELGAFAEGRALGDDGLRIAETVDHPPSRMIASCGLGLLALRQGDLPSALPRLERAMAICQDEDLRFWFPGMAVTLGAGYTLAGRLAEALPLLTRAMEQAMATALRGVQACCRLPLSEAHLRAGRVEEARGLAEQALVLARAHQERGHQAYALRCLGECAARGEPPEGARAENHYRQALTLAEELGMRPLQAHCHRGLGLLYSRTGQREQARTALSTAIALYRVMEMAFWLPETEAALAQVEGR
jgi:DNA-binding winged helix-turn-helix (wHTH) protein/tetratricopeptide (TPR) repeat protein